MKTLALYYNTHNTLQVTDSLDDLYGLPVSLTITLIDNAFEINRYLLKHKKDIYNPEFLKAELDLFRSDEKFEEKVFLGINEKDVHQLRQYLEDEVLN